MGKTEPHSPVLDTAAKSSITHTGAAVPREIPPENRFLTDGTALTVRLTSMGGIHVFKDNEL